RPFGDLGPDESIHALRRAIGDRHADLGEALPRVGLSECTLHVNVETHNDVARRCRRRRQGKPGRRLETRQRGLGHGRDVGRGGRGWGGGGGGGGARPPQRKGRAGTGPGHGGPGRGGGRGGGEAAHEKNGGGGGPRREGRGVLFCPGRGGQTFRPPYAASCQ